MDYDEKGALETTFIEVPCQRAVAKDEFVRGVQDYSWGISNPSCWFPDKSYFRVELEVYGPGGLVAANAPKMSDQVALAENCVNNAFSNAYFHAAFRITLGASRIPRVGFPTRATFASSSRCTALAASSRLTLRR